MIARVAAKRHAALVPSNVLSKDLLYFQASLRRTGLAALVPGRIVVLCAQVRALGTAVLLQPLHYWALVHVGGDLSTPPFMVLPRNDATIRDACTNIRVTADVLAMCFRTRLREVVFETLLRCP